MIEDTRVFLIGGPSHAGKSTVANRMASKLGWSHISTDSLARHPGRPWKNEFREVPAQVADHYKTLSASELVTDVIRHYDSMWPIIEALVQKHAGDPSTCRVVIEGSALLPERIASMPGDKTAAIWLTADGKLLCDRIKASSRYDGLSADERLLVEKFVARNDLYNRRIMNLLGHFRLASIDVGSAASLDELAEQCLTVLSKQTF